MNEEQVRAAAPEMYEALKALRDAWFVGSTVDVFLKACHQFMPEAELALAKAEGRIKK